MFQFSWSLFHLVPIQLISKYSAGLCLAAGSPASSLPSMPSSTGFPSLFVFVLFCFFFCLFVQVLTLIPGLMWPGSLSPSRSENTSPCLSYSPRCQHFQLSYSSRCQHLQLLLVHLIFNITSVCSLAAWVTILPTENLPTRLFNLLSYFSPGLPFHPYHLNSHGFEPCDYRRHHPHDYLSSQLGLHHNLAVRSIRPPHPGDQSLFPSSDLTNSELTGACLIWSGHGGGSRQGPRLPPPLRPPLRHALCLVGHHHNDPRHWVGHHNQHPHHWPASSIYADRQVPAVLPANGAQLSRCQPHPCRHTLPSGRKLNGEWESE